MFRNDKGVVVLDNTTDRVYSGREAVAVRPVLSFGATGQWVHGYRNEDRQPVIASIPATGQRVALASVDQRSVIAVPLIFKTGFHSKLRPDFLQGRISTSKSMHGVRGRCLPL